MENMENAYFQALFTSAYTKQTWRADMVAEKKRGGDPSYDLQHQVARMLNKVGKEKQQLAHMHGTSARG